MLRTPLALSALFVVVALAFVGCKEDAGGFGDAVNPEPGINVKKVEDPNVLPDFAGAMTVTPSYDAATQKLTVTLDIKEGFHAYGPGEETGKPVSLVVDPASGFTVKGDVAIPAGKEKNLGELGKSVILEGQVPVTAILEGTSETVRGTVNVQICTDKACDRPRPHAFQLAAK